MLRVTKLTDYATVLLTVLAEAPERVHSATELAERARLELPTVSKVLKPLAQAGLAESFRGSNGGYRLARAASAISLIEIVEAIEGTKKTFNCQEIRRNNPCIPKNSKVYSSTCGIASVMNQADQAWRQVLKQKKLSEIAKEVEQLLDADHVKKTSEWFQKKL